MVSLKAQKMDLLDGVRLILIHQDKPSWVLHALNLIFHVSVLFNNENLSLFDDFLEQEVEKIYLLSLIVLTIPKVDI